MFIAAGAFAESKPSDLIPELQGRFPIRVELNALTREDFVKILKDPSNSLIKQYTALLNADGIKLSFTKEAIEKKLPKLPMMLIREQIILALEDWQLFLKSF